MATITLAKLKAAIGSAEDAKGPGTFHTEVKDPASLVAKTPALVEMMAVNLSGYRRIAEAIIGIRLHFTRMVDVDKDGRRITRKSDPDKGDTQYRVADWQGLSAEYKAYFAEVIRPALGNVDEADWNKLKSGYGYHCSTLYSEMMTDEDKKALGLDPKTQKARKTAKQRAEADKLKAAAEQENTEQAISSALVSTADGVKERASEMAAAVADTVKDVEDLTPLLRAAVATLNRAAELVGQDTFRPTSEQARLTAAIGERLGVISSGIAKASKPKAKATSKAA